MLEAGNWNQLTLSGPEAILEAILTGRAQQEREFSLPSSCLLGSLSILLLVDPNRQLAGQGGKGLAKSQCGKQGREDWFGTEKQQLVS